MKIGVVGAGNIGCFIGGCLASQGFEVLFVGRERIFNAIQSGGLCVSDYLGLNRSLDPSKVDFVLDYESISSCDYILVTVKSGASEEVAEQVKPYLKPEAVLVSFQNGIGNADLIQARLPNHLVLKGMVPFNVVMESDGHFHRGTEGELALEAKAGAEVNLVKMLEKSGLPIHAYEDMETVQWGKLLMNLNNPINALSGIPLYDQLHDQGYRKILAASISEALAALKKAGIKPARTGKVIPPLIPHILSLPNWAFTRVAKAMLTIDKEARSSMSDDLTLGRHTEIDFLNGEVVKLGHQVNFKTPVNKKILTLIHDVEKRNNFSGYSADDLSRLLLN